MDRLQQVEKMWNICFPEVGKQWICNYLNKCVDPDDILTVQDSETDTVISSLLLQRREMLMYGEIVPVSYLSFACTMPRYRGLGSMPQLIGHALMEARGRGDMIVVLIPAASWLRDYYERVGEFATVGYKVESNYVAGRQFRHRDNFENASGHHLRDIYEAYKSLSCRDNQCIMLHSQRDFEDVVEDCRGDGGNLFAVMNTLNQSIEAVALAYTSDYYKVVTVKSIVGEHDACEALLDIVGSAYPDCRLRVLRPAPSSRVGDTRVSSLIPDAMVRIVNPEGILSVVSRQAPSLWSAEIRLTDRVMPINSSTYHVSGTGSNSSKDSRNCFDVTPAVLARMIFGSATIGKIIDFPSVRPVVSLMLE